MDRPKRLFAAILGGILLVPVVLIAALWIFFAVSYTPSKIDNFHPKDFRAQADDRFFYSMGDALKNSSGLSSEAPTLLRGRITQFLVSPDNRKIAVVADGSLMIVDRDGSAVRKVAPVDSIYREPKPLGRRFFRDSDYQWSRDSKNLYLIKDEYYQSKGSQLSSAKGELWKYDVDTGQMQLVLRPFPAYTYFFGLDSGVYFSTPTETGALELKYFDGVRERAVANSTSSTIPVDTLSADFTESPFFSFASWDYERIKPPAEGLDLKIDQRTGRENLEIGGKPILTFTQGESFKGAFYCPEMNGTAFLPGDRYFLVNVPDCGNYKGQLLVDRLNGDYQRLPADTHVYLTLNTETNPLYRITSGGISPR